MERRNDVLALQEAWEEVEKKIVQILEAGRHFSTLAENSGNVRLAVLFNTYFLDAIKNFHRGDFILFSEQNIRKQVEDLVQSYSLEEDKK